MGALTCCIGWVIFPLPWQIVVEGTSTENGSELILLGHEVGALVC